MSSINKFEVNGTSVQLNGVDISKEENKQSYQPASCQSVNDKMYEYTEYSKKLAYFNYFEDSDILNEKYINESGLYASNLNCISTKKINVLPGEHWIYNGIGRTSVLYLIWGIDKNNNKIKLLADTNKAYIDYEFIIPDNIVQIYAWSYKDDYNPMLYCISSNKNLLNRINNIIDNNLGINTDKCISQQLSTKLLLSKNDSIIKDLTSNIVSQYIVKFKLYCGDSRVKTPQEAYICALYDFKDEHKFNIQVKMIIDEDSVFTLYINYEYSELLTGKQHIQFKDATINNLSHWYIDIIIDFDLFFNFTDSTYSKLSCYINHPSDNECISIFKLSDILEQSSTDSFDKTIISHNLLDPTKITNEYYVSYFSGNLVKNENYSTSDYIEILPNETYIQNVSQQVAFYDENKTYLSGIEEVIRNVPFITPDKSKYIRICFPTNSLNNIRFNQGNYIINEKFAYGYKDLYIRYNNILESDYTIVKATHNENNYNSIRDLMKSLNATKDNQYIIYIPKGRWFECDITGHPYIKLIGEDKNETILYCDGNNSNSTPYDYSFKDYKETVLSDVPKRYKHCINVINDIYVENLTIEATNAKYCAHIDKSGKRLGTFKNCKFISYDNVNNPIGFGLWGNQHFIFDSCEFIHNINYGHCLYVHNWNNQENICKLDILNCTFNSNYITFGELGSEYSTLVNLTNCISEIQNPYINFSVEKTEDNTSYWTNPSTGEKESDFLLVPYSFKLNYIGTDIAGIKQTNRPNILNYIMGKNKQLID